MKAETLQQGWKLEALGKLSSAIQYGYTAKAQPEPVGPRLLRITDIQNDTVKWNEVPFCKIEKEEKSKYLLTPNDIVFARTGATVGKSYLIRDPIPDSVFASYLIRVRLTNDVTPKYVAYFFKSTDYWRQITESQAGIGQPNVNGKKLAQIKIPIAPANEQYRIVAEIEKQFSRLDEAVANLKRVKANLKRYKAAVLKAAVEGKLTEDWRKQHPDVEPASKLLERILAEPSSKRHSSILDSLDCSRFCKLPPTWCWSRIEDIGDVQLGRQRAPKYHSGRNMRPYLRVQNVFEDRIDLEDVMEMDFPPADFEKFRLAPGDILLNEGQSPELLGRPAIYRGELPDACFTNTLIRFRVNALMTPNYPFLVFRAYMRNRRFTKEGTITTNIAHLSAGRFAKIEFPLPPLKEQEYIVAEVEHRLSVIDELEITVQANLTRADRLRQSVLSQAFSGRLLGQDTKHIPDILPTVSIAAESQARYEKDTLAEG